jgi:hypothetical protein
MTDRHKLVPSELLNDRDVFIKYRKTRIEEDGALYQLLLAKKKIKEDKYTELLLFTKDGQSLNNIEKDMLRVFKKKSTSLRKTNLQDSRNSLGASEVVTKKSALSDILLKPVNSEEDYFYDYDFAVLPAEANGKSQYVVLKKDLELHYKDILDTTPANRGLKQIKLELDKGTITQVINTF